MKNNQFDQIIKNSLIDEEKLLPEKTLIESTKSLIEKEKKHDLWLNKIYVFCLAFICLLFSLKAIDLAIKSKNIFIISSIILWSILILILNIIFKSDFKTFLKIKEDQI